MDKPTPGKVWFPEWAEFLEGEPDERKRKSWKITIRWYLGWCKRQGCGVSIPSGGEFIHEMEAEKEAPGWMVSGWKDALRWFFTEARKHKHNGAIKGTLADEIRPAIDNIREGYERRLVEALRADNLMLQTEKTYRYWLQRFLAWLDGRDPESNGTVQVQSYLDHLAVREGLAYSTQRQALNALVYFYRRVMERDLEDMEYTRARKTRRLPVVLSREPHASWPNWHTGAVCGFPS